MTTTSTTDPDVSLAGRILDQVEALILQSEREQKPLEVDPLRSRLFELFVTAEGAGYTADDATSDLSADGLCHVLSERWGLKTAAQSSMRENTRMSAENMARMRSLWSMMRMWMEWTYAWQRWDEFHRPRT